MRCGKELVQSLGRIASGGMAGVHDIAITDLAADWLDLRAEIEQMRADVKAAGADLDRRIDALTATKNLLAAEVVEEKDKRIAAERDRDALRAKLERADVVVELLREEHGGEDPIRGCPGCMAVAAYDEVK